MVNIISVFPARTEYIIRFLHPSARFPRSYIDPTRDTLVGMPHRVKWERNPIGEYFE